MNDLNTFLEVYGLAAIFVVMLLKAAGVPIPIPGDAILLATSARAAEGKLVLWQAFVALLIALVVGGFFQFMIVRGPGHTLIERYGRYLGLTQSRIDVVARRLQKGGPVGVGIAIMTPGVRSVAIPASGIACVRPRHFAIGLLAGNLIFLMLNFAVGFVGGTLLMQISQVVPPQVLIGGFITVVVSGFGVWYVIRRRQRPDASTGEVMADALGAWQDASCPVSWCLTAIDRLQGPVEDEEPPKVKLSGISL
jgi:membrane protein DedA with SNARE-associated domain